MAEFERFSELPRELRDQIWSMAIRDDRPGVHILDSDVVSDTWAEPSLRRYFENLNEGRSDENISTYLIDGGLWAACHESRLIMERRFEQSKRKHDDGDTRPRHDRTKEVFRKATTGCFDGTPLHPVTVFPHRDLFVLQCNDLKNVNWSLIGLESSMETSTEGFNGLTHVALEYDPKWWSEAHSRTTPLCLIEYVWAIMEAAFKTWPNVWKLWFIDRSLRRKKEAPAFKETAEDDFRDQCLLCQRQEIFGDLTSHLLPVMANFSDLPREIRDMIWPLVLRDDHPGVHIFGHYDENKKDMPGGRSLMHGNLFSGILSEPSPDRYFTSLDKNRKNENISTYLIDGAMWNTCKESRLAVEKHFSQDLFVFQPNELDSVDWYFVGSRPTKGDNRPAFRRLQHIAIEYDPEWAEENESSYLAMSHLVEAAYELKDIQKLWFIDHSLKRKKAAPEFNESGDCWISLNAFYARDRKFLEIDWRSSCGPLEDWDYVKPVGDTSNEDSSSSIKFLQKFTELALERRHHEEVAESNFAARLPSHIKNGGDEPIPTEPGAMPMRLF
ncbi:hypothetical protein FCOIX_288 [Fusarium coicis]|nr:hypothetical protein FCOIX_288 [Fusarium coicis]